MSILIAIAKKKYNIPCPVGIWLNFSLDKRLKYNEV